MIDGDPKVAKELGVEVPKDPALTKAEQAEAAENDAVDGLDAAPSNCAYLSLHKLLCLTNLRSVTTETTGRGAMTMTTNSRLWGEDALPHQSAFRRDRWNHPALQDSLATSIRLKAG